MIRGCLTAAFVALGLCACRTADVGPSPERTVETRAEPVASPPAPTPSAPLVSPSREASPSLPERAPTPDPVTVPSNFKPDIFTLEWARARKSPQLEARAAALGLVRDAYALYQKHRDAEAVPLYEKALSMFAESSTYYKYGNSLSNVDRLQDAVQAYDMALALEYVQPQLAHYNRACAYSRMKRPAEAYAALSEAAKTGYSALDKLNEDPDLAYLRSLPDWQAHVDEFRPVPTALQGVLTYYGDRDFVQRYTLCPDRRAFRKTDEGLDGSCCGSTLEGELGLRKDGKLVASWSRQCGLRGVGKPKRKGEDDTCTRYPRCTEKVECVPQSYMDDLAAAADIPSITKAPPGETDELGYVYVPFQKDLPAVCTSPAQPAPDSAAPPK